MKILLDENIDVRFKRNFPVIYDVYTVRDMNWNGIKNGKLLQLLAEHNFDCWVVVDKNLPYQQNIHNIPCLIIVLDVFKNILKYIEPLIPQILEALNNPATNKIIVIKER